MFQKGNVNFNIMTSYKYIHSNIEDGTFSYSEKNAPFKLKNNSKKFSITMPTPNVTSIFYMGCALNSYIQGSLIRYHRINDRKTLQ